MRPGDRRERWKSSCNTSCVIFLLFAAGFIFLVEGNVGLIVAAVFGVMALLEFRDSQRGWRIRYDIPRRAQERADRGDIMAQTAIKRTLREAKDPDHKRYAFDE